MRAISDTFFDLTLMILSRTLLVTWAALCPWCWLSHPGLSGQTPGGSSRSSSVACCTVPREVSHHSGLCTIVRDLLAYVFSYFQPTQISILKLTHSWGDDLTSPDVTVTRGQASGGWRSERGWGGSDIGTGPVMRGAAVTWRPHLESVHLTDHLHLDALPRVPDYCDGLLHRPRGYLVDGDYLVPLPPEQYVII